MEISQTPKILPTLDQLKVIWISWKTANREASMSNTLRSPKKLRMTSKKRVRYFFLVTTEISESVQSSQSRNQSLKLLR